MADSETAPHRLHPALPLQAGQLRSLLESHLVRAGETGESTPSLAQSLTRLQHLRRNLFKAEDWEELAWLIAEGNQLEARRLAKHPLFKIGPRRRLQRRIRHFHGRAAIKTVALFDALEPPLRALAARQTGALESIPRPPLLPWNRFTLRDPDAFGAPPIAASAALLEEALPLVAHIIDLATRLGADTQPCREALEHFAWHAREVGARARDHVPLHRRWSKVRAENRLLRIALEHAHRILLKQRQLFLAHASGLDPAELDRSFDL